jgi:lipopolysaccharide/colanic/teichoic acid biosynthesis glycosyltransferase
VTGLLFRERPGYRRARRLLDLAVVGAALALAAPLLGLAALAILAEDGLPVIFAQRRVGRFGRTFTMYKLRTMRRAGCGDAYKPADGADPRITRVGRVLRALSVDELPQLVNVLRGEMSLVGPRPEMPFVTRRYERWQHVRTIVPPGITGLWQTTVRSTVPLDRPEATAIDLDYVARASLALDLALIARTFVAVAAARGAR